MALRILHTSDWHLGHVFHGVEREYEHRVVLDWLLNTLEAEASTWFTNARRSGSRRATKRKNERIAARRALRDRTEFFRSVSR
jgi:hypothetical protein